LSHDRVIHELSGDKVDASGDFVAPGFGRRLGLDAAMGVAVGLVSCVSAAWVLGVRRLSDLDGIWTVGDLLPVYSYAKNMIRGNWILVNPDLGFPGFQDHGHFPITDWVSVTQMWILTNIFDSPRVVANTFAIGTYFTAALAFYLLARFERVDRWAAAACGLAFSILPWHFMRLGHVFLSSYFSVPISLALVSMIAGRKLPNGSARHFYAALVMAIVVGSNGVYYSLMASMMLILVVFVGAARSGWRLPTGKEMLVIAMVPVSTLISVVVNRLSIRSELSGGNTVVRSPIESYHHGGNPATLAFPSPGTRSGRWLSQYLDFGFPNGGSFEGDAYLSSPAVLAILVTCWLIALRWASRAEPTRQSALWHSHYWPGLFIFVGAFFTVGGLGAVFSYWVSSDIRAWGRFSITMVAIAFLVLGIVQTTLARGENNLRRRISRISIAFVMIGSLVDISGSGSVPPVQANASLGADVSDLVTRIEAITNTNCPILQLPLVQGPEAGQRNAMGDYSHLLAYIYSNKLRWSYGAIKGTEHGSWGMNVADDPAQLFALARADGFCGVLIDSYGYPSASEATSVARSLEGPLVESGSGRWRYYGL
jgi:phosphoglycerol transferase